MKRINLGVIGCGYVAENHHLPILRYIPGLHLTALADINSSRLTRLTEKFGLQDVFTTTDYYEILNRQDIDAVMVLTPPDSHAEIIIKAIDAEKHIFCEKPFTLTIDEGVKISYALKDKNVKLMVGFNFRFIPHFVKMRKLVKKGTIGSIVEATTHFLSLMEKPSSISGFQFRPEMGGGALFEMGCHHLDLLRWTIGEIKSVQATIWKSDSLLPIDDNAIVLLEFSNGAKGSVHVSWSTPALNRVELFGRDGFIGADVRKPYLELYLQGKSIFKRGTVKIPVGNVEESYILELRHFVDCVLNDRKPLAGAEEGIEALRIVMNSYESAQKGGRTIL